MATVLNRSTKQLISSANTPDYPAADWIVEPDLSAVVGWPSKYWIITGDTVSLMDAGARASLDAAELDAERDAIAAAIDQVESYARAFVLMLLDEMNAHATAVSAILDAADAATSLADFKNRMGQISALPQRTVDQLKSALRAKLGS